MKLRYILKLLSGKEPFSAIDVRRKVYNKCGCKGKWDCECTSIANQAISDLWGEYNRNGGKMIKTTPNTDNPFIDTENNCVLDMQSLNFHVEKREEINKKIKELVTCLDVISNSDIVEDFFTEVILQVKDLVETDVHDLFSDIDQQMSDALSYEDYLADLEHERIEKEKMKMEFDYPHQGSLKRRF